MSKVAASSRSIFGDKLFVVYFDFSVQFPFFVSFINFRFFSVTILSVVDLL